MAISESLVARLEYLDSKVLVDAFQSQTNPKHFETWIWRNEIRPIDLFCYLGARFGPPNGIQSMLRADHSGNLIHWEWALGCEHGWIFINGMNFRTQVHLLGEFPFTDEDELTFREQLKADFSPYGRQMADLRKNGLENWVEFVNPYFRIKRAIDQLSKQLNSLCLDPKKDAPFTEHAFIDREQGEALSEMSARYSTGLGLCFGIRSMLPVMAEAFVNLLLFVLMKSELKTDERLRENLIRQPIDIRIKSLHHNCNGFVQAIDYADPACRKYHSLVNERNDLLHGNFTMKKLQFNEVCFLGTIPVFKEYRSLWDRSFGVDLRAAGLGELDSEMKTVSDFINYVIACLEPKVQDQINTIMETRDLGFNSVTGGLGILFPGHLVDMVPHNIDGLDKQFGTIDSGDPRSADNEIIDADLTREYGNTSD